MDKFKMDEIVDGLHQGIILDLDDYKYADLDEILEIENPLIVILDHLEDPHNLGAIIRTAETAGVHGIIIPKRRAAGVNSTVSKVASGALEYIKIARVNNINDAINKLKENGIWIYGTTIDSKQVYYKQDLTGPIAIVIGNEGKGISKSVQNNCDVLINIPMRGNVTSLNAAVSTGILLYEILRQKMKEEK